LGHRACWGIFYTRHPLPVTRHPLPVTRGKDLPLGVDCSAHDLLLQVGYQPDQDPLPQYYLPLVVGGDPHLQVAAVLQLFEHSNKDHQIKHSLTINNK